MQSGVAMSMLLPVSFGVASQRFVPTRLCSYLWKTEQPQLLDAARGLVHILIRFALPKRWPG